MLDLARILAAVSAVSEGRAPTDTAKTAPEQAVSVVSVVSAENNKDAQHTAHDDQGADAEHESLSRTLISNRYNRYNRYTSNDAGPGVSASEAATDTTDTGGTGCDSRGRPLMPLVRCGDCQNFQPNRDNPAVGCGACALGAPDLGGWPYFPGARRCCVKHSRVEARA